MVQVSNLSKSYGATHALTGVAFTANPGRVTAIIGENGSGKSTLMKLIAGEETPDSGLIAFEKDEDQRSVTLVHQELALCPHLTVAENMFLGVKSGWRFSPRLLEKQAAEILVGLGFGNIYTGARTSSLSVSERQVTEIARAVVRGSRTILLDEPTSSLNQVDKVKLYDLIQTLKHEGKTVLFISHFLEEIRAVADDVVILRDGDCVATGAMAEFEDADIIQHMVGRKVDDLFPRSERELGEVLLKLENFTGEKGIPSNIDLTVHRGEIVGIAGLAGAGRTELLRSIMGLRGVQSGSSELPGGKTNNLKLRWVSGTGFVSEERKVDGLSVNLSIAENATLASRNSFLFSPKLSEFQADHWISELGVKAKHSRQKIRELSGGNQQKIAFARLLESDSDLMLLDEPTRGIDIASKATLYQQMDFAAQRGCGILMTSSYLPELLGVCDRIVVLNRGKLMGIFDARTTNAHKLMQECIA